MADVPSLGTRIKRARERMRLAGRPMSQADLAGAIGVSRSAVNAWEKDRAVPRNAIGALEAVLGVSLSDDGQADVYTDPREARIWGWTEYSEAARHAMIKVARETDEAGQPASETGT